MTSNNVEFNLDSVFFLIVPYRLELNQFLIFALTLKVYFFLIFSKLLIKLRLFKGRILALKQAKSTKGIERLLNKL